ncbi:choice-of-anchor B family protein [Vicingaceae bacterium]|nr:choice-of-anchor B family protein [Vicingaceae bacterium]
MLKRLLLITVAILYFFTVNAQLNINLVGQLTFPSHGDVSDIWGHVDGAGNEYALVGLQDGTSIVDISTPTAPVESFFSTGAITIWRDLKVWNNHAYITNEGSGGLKIIDMSNLPGAITGADVYQFTGITYPFTKAHDIYIDENGFAYIMGADNGVGGAIILDLNSDPKIPVEVGRYNEYYIHDGMVRGDTLWAGCVDDGFLAAIDVTTKASPITMATHATPSNFTHNIWPSDDGQTVFTTDEKANAFIGAYDVSDLNNINELDRIQSSPGQNVIPHNVFVLGDYLVTSYYRDGVTIHDASDPSNIVEVGNYDTSPTFSGDGFNGCWGVYPYLPSGLIIASDIENGLFVLGPTYSPATYLDGKVTDITNSSAIDGAQIDILTTTTFTNTNILGDYQTGLATSGTYDVTYSKSGYISKTITGVILTPGNTTTVDVELQPSVPFNFQLHTEESLTSNNISGAFVTIKDNSFTTTIQTDASGNISIPNLMEGYYDVYIAKWGYEKICLINQYLGSVGNVHTYPMNNGYEDDFRFDLGWTVSGNPSSGDWERNQPNGTSFNGEASNPGIDSPSDCSEEAFVTGNGGGQAGTDDIDGGETVLLSPMFDLTSYNDAFIDFERWFFNDGGSGTPNDSLVIEILNGTSVAKIDFADFNSAPSNSWTSKSIEVSNFISISSTMQLRIRAMDNTAGHIAEAGFDNFRVVDNNPVNISELNTEQALTIYPNPFNAEINISFQNKEMKDVKVEVLDLTGRIIDQKEFNNSSNVRFINEYKRGIYFVNVYGNGKLIKTEKVIKL